jgi:hypothetical protein
MRAARAFADHSHERLPIDIAAFGNRSRRTSKACPSV